MTETVGGALSDDEVVRGLKEALSKGADRAIARLGRPGGYLDNVDVRIPLPEELQRLDKLLRTFRQDRYANEFVATLPRSTLPGGTKPCEAWPAAAATACGARRSDATAPAWAVRPGRAAAQCPGSGTNFSTLPLMQ